MEEFDIGDIVQYKTIYEGHQREFRIIDFGVREYSYLVVCVKNGVNFILEHSDIILVPSYEKKKTFKQQLEKL